MSSRTRAPRLHLLVIALGVALMAGPVAAQTQGPRAAIEAANAKFSADYAKGDATAVAAHYTAAGQGFPPERGDRSRARGHPEGLEGRDGRGGERREAGHPRGRSARDTAHEVGTYVLVGEGGKTLDNGKYVVIWKRDGGQWKLHRDIWNTSMPAPK